jgi:hypothetical protein
MLENHDRLLRNAFFVSDTRKHKNVFDKKYGKRKDFLEYIYGFREYGRGFSDPFSQKPISFRRPGNQEGGFRNSRWGGNLSGYVYGLPEGFPKRFEISGQRFF